ncbi:MAG: hypothetical protein HY293_01275 [Planctomycetes bacterium]|nr:hypothetical protein [Planctomycetota bacterium]
MSAFRSFLLGSLAPLLTGCLIIPTPGWRVPSHRYNSSPVQDITIETCSTTREDVLLALGEPDWSTPYGGAFLYVGAFIDALFILASSQSAVVIPIGHYTELLVEFAEDGRVSRVSEQQRPITSDSR